MADQIVKSNSKAYGYNYANLADIVNQGFEIPKMTTRIVEGETFIFWYDKETKEWLQGAPLVVPEMRGMNAAQAMGSALTYARRYTAQMALGLACDDDTKLEKTKDAPEATGAVYKKGVNFVEIKNKVNEINSVEELEAYWKTLKLSNAQAKVATKYFSERKAALGDGNGVE